MARGEWQESTLVAQCRTCQKCYPIVRVDYSKSGCEHIQEEGFACLLDLFDPENPQVIHMTGISAESGGCECWLPKMGVRRWMNT